MRISDWSSDVCSSDLRLPASRMRKLPQKLRLCVNLMSSSFKIIVLHSETHSPLRRDIAQRQPCVFVLLAARLGGCCRVECFSVKSMQFRRCCWLLQDLLRVSSVTPWY